MDGERKFEGDRFTRWVVARQIPRVRACRDRPILMTSVPGMGGTDIHCPDLFWTSRP